MPTKSLLIIIRLSVLVIVRAQDIVNYFERAFYLGEGSGHREQC